MLVWGFWLCHNFRFSLELVTEIGDDFIIDGLFEKNQKGINGWFD